MKLKRESRLLGEISVTSDIHAMAENGEELKSPLMKVKEESEKAGLKPNIQEMKTMAPVPLFHGKQMGKKWKQCQISFSWTPKSLQMVTVAKKLKDACSLEEKI